MVARHTFIKDLVQKMDLLLQWYALAYFNQVFTPDMAELWIMQKKIGEFRALLHQIQLRHALRFAFELLRSNSQQLAENKAGFVKDQRLVKIAGKHIFLFQSLRH